MTPDPNIWCLTGGRVIDVPGDPAASSKDPLGELGPVVPDPLPPKTDPLTGQRRRLYESLTDRDPKLAAMYLGAIMAFGQDENPERLPHAAHSLRELLEKLPRYLDVPVPAEEARLSDKVNGLAPHWDKVTADPTWNGNDWLGPVKDPLRSFLRRAKEFFAWCKTARPSTKTRTAIVLRGLDPTGQALPRPIEELRIQEWTEYRDYFVGIAHHGTEDEGTPFESWLTSLEGFLLDRFRPRTFRDQEQLRRIIDEAENADS